MITLENVGLDEDLAREVLIVARVIAPCIDSFPVGSEDQKNALAILKRVYADIVGRGSWLVKSQRIGAASVDYRDVQSAFDGQPSMALRALCGAATPLGLPQGSFPRPARVVSRMWPEDC